MNNLYNSMKYAAAPKNVNKLNLLENLRFKGMQVGEHVGKHKKPYGALAGTALAGGGYALGKKQSTKEASAMDWIKAQATKGKEYVNRNNFINSLTSTGKGSSKPGPKNVNKLNLLENLRFKGMQVGEHVGKHKKPYGALAGTALAGGGYALGKKQSTKEASYYEIGHALLQKDAGDYNADEKKNKILNAISLSMDNRIHRRALLGRRATMGDKKHNALTLTPTEQEILKAMPESTDGKTYPISRFLNYGTSAGRELFARTIKNRVQDNDTVRGSKGDRRLVKSLEGKFKKEK